MVASETTDPSKGGEEKQPKRVSSGLLVIPDGYTLRADIEEDPKPRLRIWYRPALPESVFEYQLASSKATTGAEKMRLMAEFIDPHMVRWEGLSTFNPKTGESSHLPWKSGLLMADSGVRRALATGYLTAMTNIIGGYEPGQWEQDEKNS
jgi:hypothetical protein